MTKAKTKTQTRHERIYGRRCLGKNLYVSNDSKKTNLNNSDIIIGGSGSGKTGCYCYPALKSLNDSSLVCVDTKGTLKRIFQKELKAKGYLVISLDFVNPEKSCRYNPLDAIRRNPETGNYNEQDIMKISKALIPDSLDNKEPFWAISARSVLEFFISYTLSALPEEDHNMFTIGRLHRAFFSQYGESAFLPWLEKHPDSFAAHRYAQIKSIAGAEKMMASFNAFVNTALAVFDVSELKPVFDTTDTNENSRPVLDLSELGRKKTVLFLNISDSDHCMDSLVNLFYTQLLQTLISDADRNEDGRLDIPVRIIFDDFASGSVLPDFDKIISVVRSRDIWLTLCIQSMSQLESLYSKPQALTIVNNCDHILFMGCNDSGTADFIGTRTCKAPENILALPRSKEIVIESGKAAMIIDKVPPYSYSDECEMDA